MSIKSTGKSVHDRQTPSTSKGEEEGTAIQSTEAEIRTALPENMAASMVLKHFDKSLQEFLKQGLLLWDIHGCMKELKTQVGDLERKRLNLPTENQEVTKKWKISENEKESRIDTSDSSEESSRGKRTTRGGFGVGNKTKLSLSRDLEKLLEDGQLSYQIT